VEIPQQMYCPLLCSLARHLLLQASMPS
jgi:hypothetical protein